jgi:hypothetical protein
MKYIDAEKLIAEIERRMKIMLGVEGLVTGVADNMRYQDYKSLLSFIDSLQQEQPEVDFKIEERKWVHNAVDNIFPEDGDFMSEVDFRKILKDTARHFYELGKNSK